MQRIVYPHDAGSSPVRVAIVRNHYGTLLSFWSDVSIVRAVRAKYCPKKSKPRSPSVRGFLLSAFRDRPLDQTNALIPGLGS